MVERSQSPDGSPSAASRKRLSGKAVSFNLKEDSDDSEAAGKTQSGVEQQEQKQMTQQQMQQGQGPDDQVEPPSTPPSATELSFDSTMVDRKTIAAANRVLDPKTPPDIRAAVKADAAIVAVTAASAVATAVEDIKSEAESTTLSEHSDLPSHGAGHAGGVGLDDQAAHDQEPVAPQRGADEQERRAFEQRALSAQQQGEAAAAAVAAAARREPVEDKEEEHHDEMENQPVRQPKVVEASPSGRYVRFNDLLGEGAFKKVYRAYDTTQGVEVAWNSVKVSGMSASARQRVVQEMKILQELDHPSIIHFYSSFLNKETESVVFITEMMASGTLKEFIQNRPMRLRIVKRWCRHILHALIYLHDHDPPIIHRDLKCDNIFINGSTGDIRIGDLGLASWRRNGAARSVLGTPEYMAPEMFEELYDEQVDIYAFGMCVLEMITKETPFMECSSTPQIYKKVISGTFPDCFNRLKESATKDFIRECIQMRSPGERRPSALEVRGHPFLVKRENDPDDDVDCADLLKPDSKPQLSRFNSANSLTDEDNASLPMPKPPRQRSTALQRKSTDDAGGDGSPATGGERHADGGADKAAEGTPPRKSALHPRANGLTTPARQSSPVPPFGGAQGGAEQERDEANGEDKSGGNRSGPRASVGRENRSARIAENNPHSPQQVERQVHVFPASAGSDTAGPSATDNDGPTESVRITFGVGTPVEARFGGGVDWFEGKIVDINSDGTFEIKYRDHDFENKVNPDLIRIASDGGDKFNLGEVLRRSSRQAEAEASQLDGARSGGASASPLSPMAADSSPRSVVNGSAEPPQGEPASPPRPGAHSAVSALPPRTANRLERQSSNSSSASSAFSAALQASAPGASAAGGAAGGTNSTFWRISASGPFEDQPEQVLNIRFTLRNTSAKTKQTAQFVFNLREDKPDELSSELMAEMKLPPREAEGVRKALTAFVTTYEGHLAQGSSPEMFRIAAEQPGYPASARAPRPGSPPLPPRAPGSLQSTARATPSPVVVPPPPPEEDKELAEFDRLINEEKEKYERFQAEHRKKLYEINKMREEHQRRQLQATQQASQQQQQQAQQQQAQQQVRQSAQMNGAEDEDEYDNSEEAKQRRRQRAEQRTREEKELIKQRKMREAQEAEAKLFTVDNLSLKEAENSKPGTSKATLKEQMQQQIMNEYSASRRSSGADTPVPAAAAAAQAPGTAPQQQPQQQQQQQQPAQQVADAAASSAVGAPPEAAQ